MNMRYIFNVPALLKTSGYFNSILGLISKAYDI